MNWRKFFPSVFILQVLAILLAYIDHNQTYEERNFLWCCGWAELLMYCILAIFSFVLINALVKKIRKVGVSNYWLLFGLGFLVLVCTVSFIFFGFFEYVCLTCTLS